MALKGQAKTDYQREYMRGRRSNKTPVIPVRPVTSLVRPANISDNQWNYIKFKAGKVEVVV
jgi:hypothetical protein